MLPETDPEYCSLRVPCSSILLEPTKLKRNIYAQNQEKRQSENCLCKTSRSGIDHPGVSRTSFYTVFQYWSNQRSKESRRYYEKFRRPKRSRRGRTTTGESFLYKCYRYFFYRLTSREYRNLYLSKKTLLKITTAKANNA